MTHRVLLVEDEANYRQVIAMMLADLDLLLDEAADGVQALELLEKQDYDLLITDLNMPRMDGVSLIKELDHRGRQIPTVVITAYGSVDSAVETLRLGAVDYLQKPFAEDRLRLTLDRVLRLSDLLAENRRLRATIEDRFDFSNILGESPAIVDALKVAGQIARSDATVLITGQSGTGKELVARAIHHNSSRAAGPFIAVNCAALPDTLLEAELFGAEQGAYTGANRKRRGRVELARGGTLLLDEIGDMPMLLQAKILRLIQEKTYTPLGSERELQADVRFVVATHRDLKALVEQEKFRQDLYYRVAGLPVHLPPLIDRGDDVILLAQHFIKKACRGIDRAPLALTEAASQALKAYPFPGNVRELALGLERAVLLCEGERLDVEDLHFDFIEQNRGQASQFLSSGAPAFGQGTATQASINGHFDPGTIQADSSLTQPGNFALPDQGISLEDVEKSLVQQALERVDGNKSQAAKLLGLSRATLRYRIEKFALEDK